MEKKNRAPIEALIDSVVKPVKYETLPDGDLPYATHEGILDLGGVKLKVCVLNTGQRVIDKESIMDYFGTTFYKKQQGMEVN